MKDLIKWVGDKWYRAWPFVILVGPFLLIAFKLFPSFEKKYDQAIQELMQ